MNGISEATHGSSLNEGVAQTSATFDTVDSRVSFIVGSDQIRAFLLSVLLPSTGEAGRHLSRSLMYLGMARALAAAIAGSSHGPRTSSTKPEHRGTITPAESRTKTRDSGSSTS